MSPDLNRAPWLMAVAAVLAITPTSLAHCDTLDGPVVTAARRALEMGGLEPVLAWVKAEYEPEVRAAFAQARAVRTLNDEARALADRYFYETVVRVHRLGEGASYTGLRPAGTDSGPAVAAADQALHSGEVEPVVRLVTELVADGIRARFAHAREAQRTMDRSTEQGRAFVAAYVEFVHYSKVFMSRPATKAAIVRRSADGRLVMTTPPGTVRRDVTMGPPKRPATTANERGNAGGR